MDAQAGEEVITGSFLPLRIMGARLDWLDQSWPVFKRTGVLLVGEPNGIIAPVPVGEDIGLFVIAPVVAKTFGLTLHNALSLILTAFVIIGALLAIVQLSAAFKDWITRLYAVGVIAVASLLILFGAGDVHAVAAGGVLMLLPLCVLIARRPVPISAGWFPLAIVIGGLGETLSLIRSHAGTGPLVAVVAVLLTHQATAFRVRALLVGSVALGILAVSYVGATAVTARDAYLATQRADYHPIVPAHPFWHSVYIGFGFLSNPMVVAYKDDVAIAAARRIDPALNTPPAEEWQYNWPAHEKALRTATLDLFVGHTFFAIKTAFAKFGVIQLFVLLFGNFGLLGVRRLAISNVRIPLGIAAAFSAVPGILAQPNFNYLAAFCAAITVTAVVGLGLIREAKKP